MRLIILLFSLCSTLVCQDTSRTAFLDKFVTNGFSDVIALAKELNEQFPELLNLASNDVEVSAEGVLKPGITTLSKHLFNEHYPEYDRSVAGIWFLYLFVNNRYDETTLKWSEVEKNNLNKPLSMIFEDYFYNYHIIDRAKVEALIVSLVLNDIGKVKEIHDRVGQHIDHDAVLSTMLNHSDKYQDIIPSFVALKEQQKKFIRDYFNAGMSIPQLAQAENVPGSTINFVQLSPEIRQFGFWEAFFDVSGALSHVQDYKVLQSIMGPFVIPTYLAVHDVLKLGSLDLLEDGPKYIAVEFYWSTVLKIITKAKKMYDIFEERFNPGNRRTLAQLFAQSKKNPDLKKRFCLSRLYLQARVSEADVEIFNKTFDSLFQHDQEILIQGMTRDGINNKTVMIYYAPALFTNLGSDKKTALEILARFYEAGEKLLQTMNAQIITINIREVISPKVIGANKEKLKNGEFHFDIQGDIAYAKMGGNAGKRTESELNLFTEFVQDLAVIFALKTL